MTRADLDELVYLYRPRGLLRTLEANNPPVNLMVDTRSTLVKVPESEVARQATDALGGYVYQLDHTVLMWLTLDDDEVLHVELAEDVAISLGGTLDLTQVKRLAPNITLRSDGVAKLTTSVWRFQKENPSLQVTGALLTTSGIGKERKMSFPGRVPGLVYWRTAAREGADVEPIRKALLSLDLQKDLKAFIKGASATELRTRIIRPIRWLEESADQNELRRDVEEKLVLLGSRMGVAAAASKNARHFLVGALLDSIVQSAAQRYVTKANLLEIFQNKTFVTVSPGMLQGLPIAAAASLTPVETIARDVAGIPLARRSAQRRGLVDRLRTELVSKGSLWLHGSSGLGKSTLAALLARSQGVSWRLVDLRELSIPAIRSILIGIANSFRQTSARGLILDDVPAETDNTLISAIGQVARAVADADGVLIITSTKPPQPTLAGRLRLDSKAIVRTPYLSPQDVADVVMAAGGDPKKWAPSIHAFAGGHPQLVDARVTGLEQRGWDEKELLADIIPLRDVRNDMDEERKAVRGRLLQDLQPIATELLLRLSLLHGNFDRPMALLVADRPAPIAPAGLIFDFLVGPWIEQVAPTGYRTSPLLKGSGAAGLALHLQREIKSNVLRYLMVQRPFPADQMLQIFLIAFQQEDRDGLSWFGHALLAASSTPEKSQFKRLAQEVSVFTLVDRGEGVPLIPGDRGLSTMLRFAQLRVAVATDDMKEAARIVDRALFENGLVGGDARQYLDAMIFASVIMEPRIPIRPRRWLPMLQELTAAPLMQPIFAQVPPPKGSFAGLPPTATNDEMMFITRGAALKSVNELVELIDALEQQPKAIRDRYLGAAARTNQSLHLIVSASWLAEVKQPGFDGRAAAAAYRSLSQRPSAKDNPDLAVELLCAEAIMLDDYAGDKDGALDVLRAGQDAYLNAYRLNRQRQKVFYRHAQHDEALAEFEKFRDRLPKERAVDRAYAMREAARSAAEIGDLTRARTFFEEAWESARLCGASMKPMTAGLSADCAILDFDAGKTESALDLMLRALLEADDLDPRAGVKEAFVKRILLAAIIYMRRATPDFPAARQARVYGMCSEPEPQEWFRNQPQAQPLLVWYQLAELETEIPGRAVLAELRRRTKAGGLLPLETTLVSHIAEAAVRHLDVDGLLEAMTTYPRAVTEGIRGLKEQRDTDPFNMPVGELTPIAKNEWSNAEIATAAKHAVLCFMLACAAADRRDVIADLRQKVVLIPGLAKELENLFLVMDQPSRDEKDVYVIIPSIIGRLLNGEVFDANDVFLSAVYALQLFDNSVLAPPAAEALISFYGRIWPEILEERTFSMRSPTTNGPIILEAIRRGKTALQRIAHMVLATEAAVKRSLNNDLRERFSKIATKRFKPDTMPEK
jgi:hypothetical protein